MVDGKTFFMGLIILCFGKQYPLAYLIGGIVIVWGLCECMYPTIKKFIDKIAKENVKEETKEHKKDDNQPDYTVLIKIFKQ